ncbi:proton-coupled amino acid transporter-like protein CG1139 [Condylostylus longicornis]|uniref:proton-coupled amino acid transporter-like protein CG1139 n=1 Tax=Condylostylus longicornis TaxID=2530218 RepID=UPI00244DCD80|nr:proton-coupled amino acid transporter-like protein CG1139 [Condylostylus longicornis]XP_055378768.1 proton-coupled amino acid transporter-like protein CG1139 [Condylostylus longicornis]
MLDLVISSKNKNDSRNGNVNDYDPYKHRKPEHPTTNFETFAHFVKGCVGTGLLAMPQAFSNAGYIVGIIGTIAVGVIAIFCMHILIGCMYILAKREKVPFLTYPNAMRIAFKTGPPFLRFLAPSAGYIVNWLLSIYHSGICCIYVVFIASTIKQLIDYYLIDFDIRIHMAIIILPLVLIYNIRDLKNLAPFSTVANILMCIGLSVILYYIFRDIPPISERDMFVDISKFPLFFGTTLFALESVGVIIALEQNMETPKDFLGYFGVMNRGAVVVLTLYGVFGFFGYWRYGDDALGSITLNIPKNDVLAQVVKAMFALAMYFTYPLQGYVPIDIIWYQYLSKKLQDHPRKKLIEFSIRLGIVMCTFLAAVAIPNIGLFLALIGAFCLTLLGIAFPALIEVCTRFQDRDYGRFNYILYKCAALILFAVVGLFIGTYTAIHDIVIFYSNPIGET